MHKRVQLTIQQWEQARPAHDSEMGMGKRDGRGGNLPLSLSPSKLGSGRIFARAAPAKFSRAPPSLR
eukprot:scaffold172958_cov36-Tisochrysis_lutea.AAC.5